MSAADAVDELYRVHAAGLIRFAVLLVGDKATAEDVAQDAFLWCPAHRRASHPRRCQVCPRLMQYSAG
jgi:DNA-directed RNA polymerase specialized sigma24 family protein